ncbi:hypothetical protein [Micromonospora sp. NPDC050695]|uniref:hypothetical protein n=1 Tax=Micromonospora sp. NPDC050695 TaxID=3154938 RepID=UPI0033F76EB5
MDDALEIRSERLRDGLRRTPDRGPKVALNNLGYTVRLTDPLQPRCYVAGEPGVEVAVRVEAGADRVAPVLPIEDREVLPHQLVSVLCSASGSFRAFSVRWSAMTAASTYLLTVGACRTR